MKFIALLLPVSLWLFAGCSGPRPDAGILYKQGIREMEGGDTVSAVVTLLKAVDAAGPDDADASLGRSEYTLARIFENQSKYDGARRHYCGAYAAGYISIAEYAACMSKLADSAPGSRAEWSLGEVEYRMTHRKLQEQRRMYGRKISLLIVILSGVGLVAVSAYAVYRMRMKSLRKSVEEYLSVIDQLSGAENSGYADSLNVQNDLQRRLKESLDNRFSEVRRLAETVYQFEHNPALLHRKLKELLNITAKERNILPDLAEVVNTRNHDVLERLHAAYPMLTENELQFAALILAGFTVQEMCVILGISSVQYVWMKKYRLKRKMSLPSDRDIDSFLYDFSRVESPDSNL